MSSAGPSPVTPLLLVGVLGLFLWGPQLMEGSLPIDDVKEAVMTTLSPVLVVLFITFSIVMFMNEVVVVPLVIMLVFFLLNVVTLAPILLLLGIHLIGKYSKATWSPSWTSRQSRYTAGDDGEGFGLGLFLLVTIFLVLSYMFCDAESEGCGWWIALIFVLPLVFFFSRA